MSRSLGRLAKSPTPDAVRRFRTASRRLETLIASASPESRNRKRLLKLLAKLRKKTGKLRDVDVQRALLENLSLPDQQNHRLRMLELLKEEHRRRRRKLAKALDAEALREIRKRLRRQRAEIRLDDLDPIRLAFAALPKPGPGPLGERSLHECRVRAKQARYLAELAGKSAPVKVFREELRRAQDAIGEWHDVLKLKDRAQAQFGDRRNSTLVAMLDNISRARFRTASRTLLEALRSLAREPAAGIDAPPGRKGAAFDSCAQGMSVGLSGTA
jgi:CHAD domain-containing protein